MRLETEFYKLPLRFDAARLADEISRIPEDEWRPHPEGHPGNSALPLISLYGDPSNNGVAGPMRPTASLLRCEYLQQTLAALQAVLGRSRLMRLDGNAEAKEHADTNYYWQNHVRVHVPIVTQPEVRFLCGDHEVNMAPGECWIFDTWRRHNVLNPNPTRRIHLVADTVGSAQFWSWVDQAYQPFLDSGAPEAAPRWIDYLPGAAVELDTEDVNFPVVMSPWEQEGLMNILAGDLLQADPTALQHIMDAVRPFLRQWKALWARYGIREEGWPDYRRRVDQLEKELAPFEKRWRLPNHTEAVEAVRQFILRPALTPSVAAPWIERPVFIVSPPRSGSTLLFETLARSPDLWTIGGEGHALFEGIEPLHPASHGYESNRLTDQDATAEIGKELRERLLEQLRNRDEQRLPPHTPRIRVLEKTPKNALRIPFLAKLFPDALFIHLYREPHEGLSSILEAWRSGRFVTYPKLPGWDGPPWSLLLIPGWRELRSQPRAEIAAAQWATTNRLILEDLARLPRQRWTSVAYSDLLRDPQSTMERLCRFADVHWDQTLQAPLPLSRHTLTPPAPDKWKKNAAEIQAVLEKVQPIAQQMQDLLKPKPHGVQGPQGPWRGEGAEPLLLPERTPPAPEVALRSSYTSNLPGLLEQLGGALLVTTYQSGKLITVRADGQTLNTHFRDFQSPMGLAVDRSRLTLGTKTAIWEYGNIPDAARKIQPVGKHDACYVPRRCHYTGDIRIHELAYADEELWFVNTAFSCLCTLDGVHSFVPRWWPDFVSGLSPQDRCHLNGLAIVEGRPRYVTALGQTDTAAGWRENKASGGCLIDVKTNKILLSGLCMPHSPRWHRDRLWLLESGKGTLASFDPESGRLSTVAELPGFTRGLAFAGPLAFIGLSQVRETQSFGGLPITERPQERLCGVWVVQIETGKIVGFLKFEGAIQEIFDVQLLAGIRYPEIASPDDSTTASSYVLPNEALKHVAPA